MSNENLDISKSNVATEFTNIVKVESHGISSSAEAKFKVYSNYADLSVTKTTTTPIGYVCEKLIYIITVTNNGPTKATDVILTDILPCNSICSSINLTQGTYKCCNGRIICHLGDLNANANAIAVIVIVPKRPCILTNDVFVKANEEDSDLSNNFSTTSTKIYCRRCCYCKKHSCISRKFTSCNNPYR